MAARERSPWSGLAGATTSGAGGRDAITRRARRRPGRGSGRPGTDGWRARRGSGPSTGQRDPRGSSWYGASLATGGDAVSEERLDPGHHALLGPGRDHAPEAPRLPRDLRPFRVPGVRARLPRHPSGQPGTRACRFRRRGCHECKVVDNADDMATRAAPPGSGKAELRRIPCVGGVWALPLSSSAFSTGADP